jgi:hypothetical protein
MEGFLVQHHEAVKMIPEVEQFMKLAREVLSSFPRVLLHNRPNERPSLYWVCLDLAMRLVKIDHQVSDGCMSEGTVVAFNRLVVSSMQIQEICDAACDFLLDAMHCQPGPILERIDLYATEVLRVVLGFLGPKREHYRVRNLWDFLFQCLHAPQIPVQIRGK